MTVPHLYKPRNNRPPGPPSSYQLLLGIEGHAKLGSFHLSSQSNQSWHPVAAGKLYRAVNKHSMLSVFILSTLSWNLPGGRFQGGLLNLKGLNAKAFAHCGNLFSFVFTITKKLKSHLARKRCRDHNFDLLSMLDTNLYYTHSNYRGNDPWPLWIKPIRQTIRACLWHRCPYSRAFCKSHTMLRGRHERDLKSLDHY